jgi:hypothetical protein
MHLHRITNNTFWNDSRYRSCERLFFPLNVCMSHLMLSVGRNAELIDLKDKLFSCGTFNSSSLNWSNWLMTCQVLYSPCANCIKWIIRTLCMLICPSTCFYLLNHLAYFGKTWYWEFSVEVLVWMNLIHVNFILHKVQLKLLSNLSKIACVTRHSSWSNKMFFEEQIAYFPFTWHGLHRKLKKLRGGYTDSKMI